MTVLILSHFAPPPATKDLMMMMKGFIRFIGKLTFEMKVFFCRILIYIINYSHRKLFEKITAEEVEAGLEDVDEEIPSFGDSLASYDEVYLGPNGTWSS